ncbi:hypothetical protein HDU85_001417 [Gaertneriomyces sp. JEL0708]|nr:hypothetical protein HDU85_001417 [Gaertneriomyces sp. JEL0708]
MDPEWCRAQALVLLYELSVLIFLNCCITFNVWSAVAGGGKFRDQERRRIVWFLFASFLLSLIPTLVVYVKNSAQPVGVGFQGHAVYCSYVMPIEGYAYGVLPYNAILTLLAFAMMVHASTKLILYRSRISHANQGHSNLSSTGSKSGSNSASPRISLSMCYRLVVWGACFVAIMAMSNFPQIRAVRNGHYSPNDAQINAREYSGAVVGIIVWFIFCTGAAARSFSTPAVIYRWIRGSKREEEERAMRQSGMNYYEYNNTMYSSHGYN